jgi:hypothetical protein
MYLNTEAFKECAEQALQELDANHEATDVVLVETWIRRLTKYINEAKADFNADELGERDPEVEFERSYADVYADDEARWVGGEE